MIAQFYKQFQKWGAVGTVWVISDTHFGDKELKAGIPSRPEDEELIKIINSKVGRADTLICLGDVGDIEYAKRLRGHKILICGNHDVGHTAYEEVFEEVYSGALIVGEKLIFSHEPVAIPWLYNIHGHVHEKSYKNDFNHFNVCADYVDYQPLNLNQFLKTGVLGKVPSIHRITIDQATKRSKKRGKKK